VACPIAAFGGTEDTEVSRSDLEAWRLATASHLDLWVFPGDHFYLDRRGQVLRRQSRTSCWNATCCSSGEALITAGNLGVSSGTRPLSDREVVTWLLEPKRVPDDANDLRSRPRSAIFFWPNRAVTTKVSARRALRVLRAGRLPCRAAVRKISKTPQKNNRFAVRRRNRLHCALGKSNQEDHDRFSALAVCHALLHPITLYFLGRVEP
jgi:hypothetical protein